MDLIKDYAKAPGELWKAQEKYEQNILSYVSAREHWIDRVYEYEKKLAEEIETLKEQKMAVTIMKEIAKKNCLDEYKEMLTAETMKKKFSYFIKAGEEKINTIKAIMRVNPNNSN